MHSKILLKDALGPSDLDHATVTKLHTMITGDLAQLDALCAEIEAQQRAARQG